MFLSLSHVVANGGIACFMSRYHNFPNMFHDLGDVSWSGLDTTLYIETLDNVASLTSNIYLLLEWLGYYVEITVTDRILAKLVELRRNKGWTHVNPSFVDTLQFSDESKHMLKNCPDLTSDGDSFCLVSEEEMTDWNFVTQSAVYKLQIKQQELPEKNNNSGFLIETTAISREDPEVFDVKIVLDKDKYPKDLHFPEDFCTNTFHFVLETYEDDCWNNYGITWRNRPEFGDDGISRGWIAWGDDYGFAQNLQKQARLRIYYNLLKKSDENKYTIFEYPPQRRSNQ